jgi:hypothetical protein
MKKARNVHSSVLGSVTFSACARSRRIASRVTSGTQSPVAAIFTFTELGADVPARTDLDSSKFAYNDGLMPLKPTVQRATIYRP